MLSAGRTLSDVFGLVPLGCAAHAGNLLLEDVAKIWAGLITRVEAVESFFRLSHYPRAKYLREAAKNGGTCLIRPVATRWTSNVEMVASALDNRRTIVTTLQELRDEGFKSTGFVSLGWVYEPQYWNQLRDIMGPLKAMGAFIGEVEGDSTTLGSMVDLYLTLRGELQTLVTNLPDSAAGKVTAIVEARDRHFLHDWSKCSYLLHPTFKGAQLPAEEVRQTVLFIRDKA